MRKTLFVAVICLVASVFLAATGAFTPLDVKTGLWEVTSTTKVDATGLPPQMAQIVAMMNAAPPHTWKSCVTPKQLNTNPWANGSDEKCTWTVLNSTATDMEVKGTSCMMGRNQGMNSEGTIKIHALDSEHVQATLDGTLTGNGFTAKEHATMTGKWLGATCPAGMQ
jgi:Protein of unknown function (DUF3617)